MNGRSIKFKFHLLKEAKSAYIYTLSTFITQLGSFLIVPLFWKKLSVSDYGILSVSEIIASFLAFFVGLSLDLAITRFYYEWPEELRKQRVGSLWMLSLTSSVLIGMLAILVLSLVSNYLFPAVDFYPYILLGLIATILNNFSVIPYATIRIAHQPRLYFVYSIACFAIQLSLNIYFVLFLAKGVQGYFISNIIGAAITGGIGSIVMLRFAVPCFKLEGLHSAIKFSLHNIPASMIAGVTSITDRFLLQQFATLNVLGIYSICLKFTNLVLALHNALKLSFVPYMVKAVEEKNAEGANNLARMRLFYLLPIFVFSMAIAIFIKDFVHFVNRMEYFVVIQWVPWLIGTVLISSFTVYLAPGLFLAKRTDKMWIPSVIQLLVVIAGGLLLIPSFQLSGVVISRYVSVSTLLLVHVILSQKYYPIPVPWHKLAMLLVLIAGGVGVSSRIEFDNLFFNIATKGLLLVAFAVSCLIVVIGRLSVMRLFREHAFSK
ncbi:MAG: polysaccharide biosynthesis [Geobacteraceae bacterium]|nr:MAG: polysaccharide biosynthesis [Geobacteraceae bacterium]